MLSLISVRAITLRKRVASQIEFMWLVYNANNFTTAVGRYLVGQADLPDGVEILGRVKREALDMVGGGDILLVQAPNGPVFIGGINQKYIDRFPRVIVV